MKTMQTVFQRYEKKYLLEPDQAAAVRRALEGHMLEDRYGQHTICNLYYDTPD
ncbi:MAG: molecular chaperone, partial [Clostridia bacterium]|nr:molecular chaperone [Clostridia bacterium]